jgi:hypothetical protein
VNETYRPVLPVMRFALILGAILTFLSGVQLFVLTDRTADLFAWTIAAGSSATIIGAFYWTACCLSFLSWRRQPWVRARVGVPGVALFLWATLLTTVIHLDKFHFTGGVTARMAAWAWLIIYLVDPILVTVALVLQWRGVGPDPARSRLLAKPYRVLLLIAAAVFAVLGLAMLFAPEAVVTAASWPLTPLTSRAIGSWVLAMGVVFATMAWENDLDRIRPAAVASLVLPVLIVVGALRYWGQFSWGVAGGLMAGLVVLVAIIGVLGLVGSGRTVRPQASPARV